ncbi:MAG: methionine--tRNA ligase [Candidatus Levybacteria bacterium RIFCSPLOWO2_01_FULL_39_24]|nr:MAG: methionine--tRNA ligase [Candidatus Levybacteria bacterium RIFCSPHIGHO2_01_FULL_40_16]OGH46721.1 MAG: methionine--tRNA ligase [Candidatus Levybacteria bacterium RIFCSPLOWO2_01_FULL_39_24]
MSKFYITTAIDYVNDTIHLGHAFQKIAADVLARYHRITLGKDNVFFLTGTDEYGQKAEKAAKLENIPPKEFVKKISDSDQKEQDSLNISYNRFIRTTDLDHAEVVKEIWNRVQKNGDVYSGEYQGSYCEGCEAYYVKEDLIKGKCPVHPTLEIKIVKEQNYFFKWSKYKDFLIDHIKKNPDFIYPAHRAKEMLEFAKNIKDIPISRSNFTWGIPVPARNASHSDAGEPEDSKQIIYVWFDALVNYLTGVGFLKDKELFAKFWPADVHILGKDNLRWHALLWPAMLKSAGIELPKAILVNGFLNINGQKISKSVGNVIRPTDWVKKYGADAVRYYLLRYTNLTDDSDISEEKLLQAYNADLANGLGNLVARVAKLCENNNLNLTKLKQDRPNQILEEIKPLLEGFKLNDALSYVWGSIKGLDQYINRERPWQKELIEANKILSNIVIGSEALTSLNEIAEALKIFLPETAEKIEGQFCGPKIISGKPLFPRI